MLLWFVSSRSTIYLPKATFFLPPIHPSTNWGYPACEIQCTHSGFKAVGAYLPKKNMTKVPTVLPFTWDVSRKKLSDEIKCWNLSLPFANFRVVNSASIRPYILGETWHCGGTLRFIPSRYSPDNYPLKNAAWKMYFPLETVPFQVTFIHFQGYISTSWWFEPI